MPTISRSQKIFLGLVILFAAVGLVDSILVHLKEIDALTHPDAFNSCKIGTRLDCGAVARSTYSHIFGVPVSLFGILFYEAILVLGVALAFGFTLKTWQKWAATILIVLGFLFSSNLLYISYFGIGAFCIYCLVSDGAITLLTISWLLYAHKK